MLKQILSPLFAALVLCVTATTLPAATNDSSLIAVLKSDAPPQEQWKAAHQLALTGSAGVASELAPLLGDERRSLMARYVLEALPFASANEALRQQLSATKGRTLAGVITSLSVRRDTKAVARLVKCLNDPDAEVVTATLAALGRIGTVPAAKAIEARISNAPEKLRTQYWAGLLQCAETLRTDGHTGDAFEFFRSISSANAPASVHEAAVRGMLLTGGKETLKLLAQDVVTETRSVLHLVQRELPGRDVTDVLFAALPKLSPDRQVLVIEAMGQRGDAQSISDLISVARDGDTTERLAAIRSVKDDVSLAPALVDLISDPNKDVAQAACSRLGSLPGAEADAAILKLLDSESPDLELAATQMAGQRRLHSATPALAREAASQDPGLAGAALTALSETAGENDVAALSELFSHPSADADAAKSLLVAIGGNARQPEAYRNRIIDTANHSAPAIQSALQQVAGELDSGRVSSATSVAGYPFFPFCIDWHDAKKRNYVQQAAMLKELGYEGVGHIYLDGVAERLKSLDAAGLKLYQITMAVDLTPGKTPYDRRFKEVLALLKGRHVQFDLIFNGGRSSDASLDSRAVEILREMSDLAQDSGSQLLLYPHQGSWVERVEDAVRVAEKINRPNVGVMFNLCHWLRVDKQRDYKPLLAHAISRLGAVSICGADQFDSAPGWAHYIQPLDKGSFNVGLMLKTLKELGYRGPIGLQCYGIGGDAQEHLARSMSAWQKLSANLKGTDIGPGYDDTPFLPNSPWRVHDRRRPQPLSIDPGEQTFAKAPADAIILFDGHDLSQWRGGNEKGIENGCINIFKTGELNTRQDFGDCQLHAEWVTPTNADDRMEWGNSGIFFLGLYELQIIESHDSYIYADGNAGAIYGQFPPLVNSSRKPGEWQSFDVVFTAPQFDGEKVIKPACFTVFQNGVLVQNHQAAIGPTVHHALPKYDDATRVSKGPITLQDHGSPVLFRNIWIRPLPPEQQLPLHPLTAR